MKVIACLLVSALGFSMGLGLAPAALAYAFEIRWVMTCAPMAASGWMTAPAKTTVPAPSFTDSCTLLCG